ncbi:MAG: PAS domain-containing protein, partial [Lachnospira sp.]|nr:PAS domain-containing protein [Lachnospira sp.]
MVDLFKTETVNETVNSDILIDETMSIVTADENFEVISGNNALFVYTRYIHPDDVSRFTEALKDYAESGKFIVVRMLYQTGEYHWMLTRITDGGVSETRGHMYDINIMDAALITAQIDNLNSQIERYSSYLGMCENVLFSYDILNDDFNIFMTSDGHQTMSFYHGTLNAWEEDKIKTDVLGLNEVKELDGFCKALANGEKLFKREININILNKPGRLDKCLARGNTIVDAYGNRIVIGTIIILESSDNH